MQDDLLRYSCQLALPGFTRETQQKLSGASVLVVGIGGLGCPAALYLASSGIGTLGIADFDVINISNLHRQILYTPSQVGQSKSIIATNHLQNLNPSITVVSHNFEISVNNVMEVLQQYDIILDCTDNFTTRYLLNDACVLLGKPLVYGAIYQYEGQVAVWNTLTEQGQRTPNYRDLFPSIDASQIPNCSEGGVIPPIAGIIGCMQANEAIKYFTVAGDLLAGKLFILDALTCISRIIKIGNLSHTTITSLEDAETVKYITPKELNKLITDHASLQLIDVRTTEERNGYNIGGIHIPLEELILEESYEANSPVVLYCASGRRSYEGAKILSNKFPGGEYLSLRGGIKAWKEMIQG